MKATKSLLRTGLFNRSVFCRAALDARTILFSASFLTALVLPPAGHGQGAFSGNAPERFGVVDIVPYFSSGEVDQNSEPSLAAGTGSFYGDFIVHSFSMNPVIGGFPNGFLDNFYYTSVNGGTTWSNAGQIVDWDLTLDWTPGGTVYGALDATPNVLQVTQSFGLPGAFSPIIESYSALNNAPPDQPWVRAVTVKSTLFSADHIYVGFNDIGRAKGTTAATSTGKTASVLYSLDSGVTWNDVVIEQVVPGEGQDSPAVRLALSPDGMTVYALFQRWRHIGVDFLADVVLTRDDNAAGTFTALPINGNGGYDGVHDTQVAAFVPVSVFTSLGAERLESGCDVAINPAAPNEVYVAYTTILPGTGSGIPAVPIIVVQHSVDSGVTFTQVYSTTSSSSLPALAVLKDGTFGMLYAAKQGANLEVDFLKAPQGNFGSGSIVVRKLATWPNNNPSLIGNPYIGDYFQLRAVGYNFYGVFSAANAPIPANFPSGVYYQRNVKVGSTIQHNFWLGASGDLVDLGGTSVPVSIDPFFFYDIAAITIPINNSSTMSLSMTLAKSINPVDPYTGFNHFNWPALPASFPQYQLQASPVLGPHASWTVQTNGLIQTNGEFELAPDMTQPQQFFRLSQNVASGQFRTFTAVDDNGTLSPSGVLTNAGLTSQTFTATPATNYAVANWCLDGVVVQSGSPTLTISNITTEHTLLVTFAPTHDIAVSVVGYAVTPGPALVDNDFIYEIDIGNTGLGAVTGVTMTNILDPSVTFESAVSSQGSVTNFGNVVIANIGTLSNGASATIMITVTPNSETTITNTVTVACNQFEPNLANNTAMDIRSILTPAEINTQPTNQVVSAGGTATFTVGVSGTPPFFYQWLFNGASIAGATNAILTITNVTGANAGPYEVGVFQEPGGPEDVIQVESDQATLTVGP